METTIRPLFEVLGEVPDPRHVRGRRYPLAAVLALVCLATMCGYKSYGAMANWIADYGFHWLPRLGFERGTAPSVGTLHAILTRLDAQKLEEILGQWAQSVLGANATNATNAENAENAARVVAIDGKTLRSSAKQGAPGSHLLSAVAPLLGLTLNQKAVPNKTNEIGAIHEVLEALVLEGRIVTVDALLTQRAVAQAIVEKGGTT
jgi:type VI protein secretion system component VasF